MDRFGAALLDTDWDSVCPSGTEPDALVSAFEARIACLTDELFPLRTVRARSNEEPWITEGIRRLSKLKKRIFKRDGKSSFWFRLRDEMVEKLATSKSAFMDKAASSGSQKAFYSATKAISTCERPSQWSVADIFPHDSIEAAASKVADYFARIGDLFVPLSPEDAVTIPRAPISEPEVLKYLKSAKKPNSAVDGDMLPRLMKVHYAKVLTPVARIFNSVFRCSQWPSQWKVETTVVIPKTNSPDNLDDCRNISCTAFLSKVLESVLLDDLRSELLPDESQYGGIKKCSVDHMLIDLYDAILQPLEHGHPSAILAIDFEKAFNRLDHRECLVQLQKLGASDTSLALVRSFLTCRTMRVRIGDHLSPPRILMGGSPQGSILGCKLYCAATQQINSNLIQQPLQPPLATGGPEDWPGGIAASDLEDDTHEGFRLMALLSPGYVSNSSEDSFKTAPSISPRAGGPDGGVGLDEDKKPIFFKYVDDTTVVETLDKDQAIRHISVEEPQEHVNAPGTEILTNNIVSRANDIGMRVNCRKTQLMVISVDNSYRTSSSIQADGEVIHSSSSVKLLGFVVGPDGVKDQMKLIRNKFRRKFWSLIHWKRAGLSGMKLYKLYCTYVRPVIEVNCVVYHSMLSKTQVKDLEKLQKKAIRISFGKFTCYKDAMKRWGLESLEERRVRAVRRFTAKTLANNPRFADKWFSRREEVEIGLRNRRLFIERKARTERYKNSPLLHLQRTANDIITRVRND